LTKHLQWRSLLQWQTQSGEKRVDELCRWQIYFGPIFNKARIRRRLNPACIFFKPFFLIIHIIAVITIILLFFTSSFASYVQSENAVHVRRVVDATDPCTKIVPSLHPTSLPTIPAPSSVSARRSLLEATTAATADDDDSASTARLECGDSVVASNEGLESYQGNPSGDAMFVFQGETKKKKKI
jgi:hypothetical protein